MQTTPIAPVFEAARPDAVKAPARGGGRILPLDGVRGLAIIMVLLWHYAAMQLTHQPGVALNFVREMLGLCWSGVDLFFVLSGFLLGGILIDNRNSRNYFKTFYLRRVSRIFPLYYGWIFIVVCAQYLLKHTKFSPLFDGFNSPWPFLAYIQNFTQVLSPGTDGGPVLSVTWSLAVEEQFYLILPFIIYVTPPKRLLGCLLLFIFSSTVFRLAMWYYGPSQGWAGYVLFPCRWDSLFVGVLGAWLIRQTAFADWLKGNRLVLYGLMLMIGMVLTILRIEKEGNLMYWGMHMLGYSLLAAFYLSLILLVVSDPQSWLARLFSMRWLCALGVISYGIYVYHMAIEFVLHLSVGHPKPVISSWSDVGLTFAAFLISVLIATASWCWVESKFIRWGKSAAY